jgi:hypothetical protein
MRVVYRQMDELLSGERADPKVTRTGYIREPGKPYEPSVLQLSS